MMPAKASPPLNKVLSQTHKFWCKTLRDVGFFLAPDGMIDLINKTTWLIFLLAKQIISCLIFLREK